MLAKIKSKILEWKQKNKLSRGDIHKEFTSWDKILKIAFIFNKKDINNSHCINTFVEKNDKEKIQYQVIYFDAEFKSKNQRESNLTWCFGDESFSLFGAVTQEALQQFVDTQFDYLFVLDTESNPFVNQVVKLSNAKCVVGKYEENNISYFDLMVSNSNSEKIEDRLSAMKLLLQKLNC